MGAPSRPPASVGRQGPSERSLRHHLWRPREVTAKLAGLKRNTKLWWDSEGAMQTALENGEVKGGAYFSDVAKTMEDSGVSLKTVFPTEGPLIDYGCWRQPTSSTKTAEADAFIDFMCEPSTQNLLRL